jgi:hypothetical protein
MGTMGTRRVRAIAMHGRRTSSLAKDAAKDRLEWIIFRIGATTSSQGPGAAGCDAKRAHATGEGTAREPGDADLGSAAGLVKEQTGSGSTGHARPRDVAQELLESSDDVLAILGPRAAFVSRVVPFG